MTETFTIVKEKNIYASLSIILMIIVSFIIFIFGILIYLIPIYEIVYGFMITENCEIINSFTLAKWLSLNGFIKIIVNICYYNYEESRQNFILKYIYVSFLLIQLLWGIFGSVFLALYYKKDCVSSMDNLFITSIYFALISNYYSFYYIYTFIKETK